MNPAKRLWQWHLIQEDGHRAKQSLAALLDEAKRLEERVLRLTKEKESIAVSDDLEQQIARLLLEQELYLAEKDWQAFGVERAEREATIRRQIEQCDWEKQQLEQTLDPELIEEYRRLAESLQPPLAEVKNEVCTGCYLALSLSKLAEWRRAKGLVYCEQCGRILV